MSKEQTIPFAKSQMLYQTNVIETIAQCDLLIAETRDEINGLILKKSTYEGQIANNSNLANVIPTQIVDLDTLIAAKQIQLQAETETVERNTIQMEINRLSNKKMSYENRLENFAGSNLLDKQLDVAKIEKTLEALNDFKTMLETRKADLQASASAA
jgi:hypothetical protein